jgi:hypothetical protein
MSKAQRGGSTASAFLGNDMVKFCCAALPALILASSLSACGGGGGSPGVTTFTVNGKPGDPNATALTAHAPVLTFSPTTLTASPLVHTSATVSFTATVTTPDEFKGATEVYVFLIDDNGVILKDPQITQTGDFQYRVNVTTEPSLATGSHSGKFNVRVCKDKACSTQFPGSPAPLPYEFTVKTST